MICICTPSRGLIHSRTVESILAGYSALSQLKYPVSISLTHDLPIPDAHNQCVEDAINAKADTIIFVEEDMALDPETFIALAESKEPITTVQYNDKSGEDGIIHTNTKGEVIWCGLGATAIKIEVFEALGVPYFSTERRYKVVRGELEQIENPGSKWSYGGLDVDFFTRARAKGFNIKVLEGHKAKHYKLNALGKDHDNDGVHNISEV